MNRPLTLLLTILLGAALVKASVFEDAARLYVEGKMEQARQLAELGLRQNPDDEKLKALLEKIKKQNDKQKQKDKNKGESGDKDQQKNQDQDKQNKPDEKKDKKEQQDKQNGQNKPQQGGDKDKKEEQSAGKKQKISREEARRILNALKEAEKDAQKKKPPIKVPARRKTDKDW